MKNARAITGAILIVCVAALIVWDVFAAAFGGPGATISELTLGTSLRHPVIPFAVGVVCGHLFWPQKKTE